MGSRSAKGPRSSGPLFVVSMWRSGSSLLYALLNKHPEVSLMYEADLMLLRSVFVKPHGQCDWAQRWQFWNEAFTRHGMDAGEFEAEGSDFGSAFEAAHRAYAQRKGAGIWGDKSPNYYDRLREMAETFPDARFIIVWRDPLETVNSILRAAQSGNSYFRRRGSTLRGLIGCGVFKERTDWLRSNGKAVLEVSYEDLVSDTRGVLREVCRFLEIEYSDELATLEGADRSAIYSGKHHSLVRGNEIVAGPRPMVVDSELRAKVDRYVRYWKQRYEGAWPPFHRFEGLNAESAGVLERSIDKVGYRLLRRWDRFTAFCFSVVPISLLAEYRSRKSRKSPARVERARPVEAAPAKEA